MKAEDKHIWVTLDFVPVEERLPDEDDEREELLLVILNGDTLSQAWHSWSSGTEEHFWELGKDAQPGDIVTHWADIKLMTRKEGR